LAEAGLEAALGAGFGFGADDFFQLLERTPALLGGAGQEVSPRAL
jgi:hypothetical protein